MSDGKHLAIIVCGRVGGWQAIPVPGARVGECDSCKNAIWIGPSSDEQIKAGAVTRCMECALPLMRAAQQRGELEMQALSDQPVELLKFATERLLRGK